MREIKFRAWDTELKEWIKCDKPGDCVNVAIAFPKSIVLMQSTGIKDKNGKEIYEGDILLIKTKSWKEETGNPCWEKEVVWIKSDTLCHTKAYFDFETKKKWDNGYSYDDWDDKWESCKNIKVIGNIYENPELLTQPPER
jgi:uncharacterized phage protein (TIGR01671 family)